MERLADHGQCVASEEGEPNRPVRGAAAEFDDVDPGQVFGDEIDLAPGISRMPQVG